MQTQRLIHFTEFWPSLICQPKTGRQTMEATMERERVLKWWKSYQSRCNVISNSMSQNIICSVAPDKRQLCYHHLIERMNNAQQYLQGWYIHSFTEKEHKRPIKVMLFFLIKMKIKAYMLHSFGLFNKDFVVWL